MTQTENIMSEFEAALTAVLQASHMPACTTIDMRSRLVRARGAAEKERDAGHDKQYNAAVDRAFLSAMSNFR